MAWGFRCSYGRSRSSMGLKIVIVPGLTLPKVSRTDLERIREAGDGAEVLVVDAETASTACESADVLFGTLSRQTFARAKKLKWVHSNTSGVDFFLFPEFVESDVLLTSEKGLVGEHLADHAFGLLLMLTRQLKTTIQYGTAAWNHRPEMRAKMFELTGLNMGVFGFGGTGKATARRAHAFGMKVSAVDREQVEPTLEVPDVWGPERLDDLVLSADVLSLCTPLTKETRGLFDRQRFESMKSTAILVNVTRGEIVIEDDLVWALENDQIAGAALDVTPEEPLPPSSRLWSLPNVVMSPHTAGASQFRSSRNIDRFVRNLDLFLRGENLEGLIDKRLGY